MLNSITTANADYFFEKLVGNKRIVLVGPSKSVVSNDAAFIEAFDLVVRLNYQWPVASELQPFIGSRLDILYHNSAGLRPISEILVPELSRSKFIWFDRNRNMFHIKRFAHEYNVPYGNIRSFRSALAARIGSDPNQGTLAIDHLMSFPIHSLYVTGITFYREPYMLHYPETDLASHTEVKTRVTPHHNVDQQLDYFYNTHWRDPRLQVDQILQQIIEERFS